VQKINMGVMDKCIFCDSGNVQVFRISSDNIVYLCHHCGKSYHSSDLKREGRFYK